MQRQGLLAFVTMIACGVGMAYAAPVITYVESGTPAHAQPGQPVYFMVDGLVEPVRVFFSDGVAPSVEAAPVVVDIDRGMVLASVPAGAVTGEMKISADGVDSDPYRFTVDAGSFDPGTRTVSGTVTDGTSPVAGALVILLAFDDCDDDTIWSYSITDAGGGYSLTGQDGEHLVFGFPPLTAGLATGGVPVVLGSNPVIQNVVLTPGTEVTGRVVFAAMPSVGVPDCRVDFDSDASFDVVLTDSNGYYSVHLQTGDYEVEIAPGAAALLSGVMDVALTVGAASPQMVPDAELVGGVEITGVVRRASDATPLSNVEVMAQEEQTCCLPDDFAVSGGDGSFSLIVPPNRTYSLNTWTDDDQPYVDLNIGGIDVGAGGATQDLDLPDAAFITGSVVDAQSGLPLFEFGVHAENYPYDGWWAAGTTTCEDGSFRLRVAPDPQGYLVVGQHWEENGYVPMTWDGTYDGTFFPCRGLPVAAPTAGGEVSGIDLRMPPGAGSISGSVTTQGSGCATPVSVSPWIAVDDGIDGDCTLGLHDFDTPQGEYRVHSLPNSDLIPSLRVCVYSIPDAAPQCYTMNQPPDYDPLVVPAGINVMDVDFCVGDTPVAEVTGLEAAKTATDVVFSWSACDDPYFTSYRLRGATDVVPFGGGSFPNDPTFAPEYDGPDTTTMIPLESPNTFFLLTAVGPTGIEGPSGSYGN